MSHDYFIKNHNQTVSAFGLPALVKAVEDLVQDGCEMLENTAYRAGGTYFVSFKGEHGPTAEREKAEKEEAQAKAKAQKEAEEAAKAAEDEKQKQLNLVTPKDVEQPEQKEAVVETITEETPVKENEDKGTLVVEEKTNNKRGRPKKS